MVEDEDDSSDEDDEEGEVVHGTLQVNDPVPKPLRELQQVIFNLFIVMYCITKSNI